MNGPLRIGILGTAKIARSFVQGVRDSKEVVVSAVASREPAKAAQFAKDLGIARHLKSYEALLADSAIDAIYNPLPNSLHARWSIEASRAGKHVLCEKPLAASVAEARAMFAAARECGVHLVEGYPYRAQPQTQKLQELIRSGVIGDVRLIQSSFGFTLTDTQNIRMNAELAGGALMDVGVYPISLIRLVAGQRPTQVQAFAQWTQGGVDAALAATLEFPGGLLAQITCSFATCVHRQAMIAGAGGTIQTNFPNHTSAQQPAAMQLRIGTDVHAVDSVVTSPPINGFLAEAESFAAMVRGGPSQWNGATTEESIDIMMIIEAILRSARQGGRVERLAEGLPTG